MPHQNKYDWTLIQAEYDKGQTLRGLRTIFGVQMQALNKARKRGDLVTRSRSVAAQSGPPRVIPQCPIYLKKLAITQSTANRGGRCKWFTVSGQRLQGTWERDLAIKMDSVGIVWRKLANQRDIVSYVLDGKVRNYTPDFYLPECDVYLELKGYWWGDDRRKMDAVVRQHPKLRLIIVEKEDFAAALAA